MLVLDQPLQMKKYISDLRSANPKLTIGFVPTMGALHSGHEELLKRSKAENEISILSIFVNPTQFNDQNDFLKYPKTLEADTHIAKKNGVDCVFLPNFENMYPDDYHFKMIENSFSQKLCGAHRPGHFDGVLSIVMKLFNIIAPDKAYFGEKDYQQLTLIKNMVDAFFMDLKIIPVETLRDQDGLALSSRNTRLTEDQRKLAPMLYAVLKSAKSADQAIEILNANGFKVDYIEDLMGRRFAAAFLGEVRLIDNVKI